MRWFDVAVLFLIALSVGLLFMPAARKHSSDSDFTTAKCEAGFLPYRSQHAVHGDQTILCLKMVETREVAR